MAAYRLHETNLDNGLTVVTVAMPHLHSATISVFARVGSRHEEPSSNGLSHFLEHMFFRGCEGYPDSTALNSAMEDLGGFLDGYTTRDYSGYQTTVHPQFVGEATELLGRMFSAPNFRDIDIERSIILEEILDALDDRGRQIDLDVIAHQDAFQDHPLGQSIDGPRANLKRFSDQDLERHRRNFYGAKNLVLCFAGAIDPKACRKAAQKSFGKLFPGRKAHEGKPPALPKRTPRFRFVHSDDAQTRARLTFRTVSDVHPDYPALLLLRRVVDGGLSARLQVELVEKRGIVYEIGAELESYSDCGLFDFELAVAHKKLSYALEELCVVIRRLATESVGTEELDRVRRRARFGVELGLDSTLELSHWYGAVRLFHPPVSPEERLQQLERVTSEDLARVARRYLSPERLTVAAVGGADAKTVKKAKGVLRDFAKSLQVR
ncbi:MAG: insulinase family protein [Deltaproteobacteria bacterium]|nr:insulinase family protein [Deltaproteobacteria bacterium]